MLKKFIIIVVIFLLILVLISQYIGLYSKKYIYKDIDKIPKMETAIVLGAFVNNSSDTPSFVLKQRLDKTYKLYKMGKIKRIIVSGDHGQEEYDEVNVMRNYLIRKGVKSEDIFLDHAGFDTYSSIVRAKEIFEVDSAIIVTQEFHISRAVYVGRKNKMNVYGLISNPNGEYEYTSYIIRDRISRVKVFFDVLRKRTPKYLGEKIPIDGSNEKTLDK